MTEAAASKYPIFPIRLLLKDKYESNKKIKNIKSPILIMHGKIDLMKHYDHEIFKNRYNKYIIFN